jgi:hypothetical protein
LRQGWQIAAVVSLGLILILLACGKKGPPFLPDGSMALRIEDLRGEWEDGNAVLKGSITAPSSKEKTLQDVTGYRVYHAWYPLERPPCDGCPVEYQWLRDMERAEIRGDRFSCQIPGIKRKGIHFFEVRLVGRRGAVGPRSNRIRLVVD